VSVLGQKRPRFEQAPGELIRAGAVRDAALNVVILALAHCRGLSATRADMVVLKSFAEIRLAQRLAPGSKGAHRRLFAGLLPGPIADPPMPDAWLPSELGELGYQTVGVADGESFRLPELQWGFDRFTMLGHDAPAQLAALVNAIEPGRPFFAFANLVETRHAPGLVLSGQAAAAERVDAALPAFLSALPQNTLVVTCSDHGVCLGEGNCWGVRRNHEVHRDVFVARFRLDGEPWP
jgi:hypothetical protein